MTKCRIAYIFGDILISKKFTVEVLEWITKQKKLWLLGLGWNTISTIWTPDFQIKSILVFKKMSPIINLTSFDELS